MTAPAQSYEERLNERLAAYNAIHMSPPITLLDYLKETVPTEYRPWKTKHFPDYRRRLRKKDWDAKWSRTARGAVEMFRVYSVDHDYFLYLGHTDTEGWERTVAALWRGELPAGTRGDGSPRDAIGADE